ncbi:MAG: hypothetical protein JKY87_05495 [Mariprofundus sp.]|nr:hypothetical protein [Mariprofundus sp.]
MQAISQAIGTFSPIRASTRNAVAPKPIPEAIQAQALKAEAVKETGMWENDSFSFWDIIDAINPLQHIPVLSTLYRKITGDEMGYAARISGASLYSGLFGSLISGLISAVANVFVDSTTGKDIGEHVMASLTPAQAHSATSTQPRQTTATVLSSSGSAAITAQQATSLPPIDLSKTQAGIDQYKWQIMADEVKNRSNYWA